MNIRWLGVAAALLAALPTSLVWAQPTANDPEPTWQVTVGGAALAVQLPWKQSDVQSAVLPFVSADYGSWHFGVDHLVNYQWLGQGDWRLSTGLSLRDLGYDSSSSLLSSFSDDPVFTGYRGPSAEVIADVTAGWRWGYLQLGYDVSGKSDAAHAELGLQVPIWQNQRGWQVQWQAAVQWYAADFVNHYYGVAAEQVNDAVGRHLYHGDAATNGVMAVQALIPLAGQWALQLKWQQEWLASSISDSPLIDRNTISSVLVSVGYRF